MRNIYILISLFFVTQESISQISESQVIANANAYLNHSWYANSNNIGQGNCSNGTSYNTPGWVTVGNHIGLPYCWGNNSSINAFDNGLSQGKPAGDNNTSSDADNCTLGVDCSGFVSRCYGLATHYNTVMLDENNLFGHYSSYNQLQVGDFVNKPGSHTRLVTQVNNNGSINVIESGQGNNQWRVFSASYTFSELINDGYNPQYYTSMTTGSPNLDCSNAVNLSCGVVYSGGSSSASSNVLNYGCNSWTESGPERVHTITPTASGTITATISNFTGDLDVYILGSCNPSDCLGTVLSSSATYTNAQAGTTYYIVVDADDGSGSSYDLIVNCPTVSSCNPPTNLNITNIEETTATFSWSLSNADGYEIEQRVAGGSWNPIASTTQTATSWNLSGLNSDTEYEVRIKGICSNGTEVSNWVYVSFTTVNNNCNPPTNLNISNITETSATFNWSLSNADGYDIEMRPSNGSWVPIASTTQTATSWNLSGLNSNTEYEVRIKGICNNGTEVSNWVYISFTTNGNNNPPANDNCSNAITLTSSTSCSNTFGTIDYATDDGFSNNPTCDAHSNPNAFGVFYSFTAVSNTHSITVNPTGQLDAVVTIYSGNSCNSLSEFDCEDTTGGNGVTTTLTNNNFVIGQQYWVRVYDYGSSEPPIGEGGFNICITHQNTNTDGIDLVSNITSVSNDNPDAGDTITVNYTITNNGDETMTTNTTSALYLSTNQTYGSSDVLITGSVYALTTNLSPNQSINLSPTVTLPSVSDGQYYIISYPDLPNLITESDNNNNTDAYAIQIGEVVQNGPNLDVKRVRSVPDDGLVPGQEVELEIKIENEGNEDSSSFDVLVYLDIDDDGNPDSNEFMGEFSFSALDADEEETIFEDFNLPANIPSTGTYDLIVLADSNNDINETNENDNDKTERVTIVLVNNDAENDVVVLNQTVSSTNVIAGQNIDVTVDHVYLGNNTRDDLPSISLGYYLSTDCNLSIDDILLDDETSSIGIDKPVQDEDDTLTIPQGTLTGTYYILFVADNEYDIDEGNFEDNNVECIEIIVTNNTTPVGDITVIDGYCLPENIVSNSETYLLTNIGYSGGQIDANSYKVHYYFSTDCVLSDNDIFLDDDNAGLGSDNTISTETSAIVLPANLPVGTYYILILADAENELLETNENNNISCVEFNIVSTDTNYQDVTLSNPYVASTEANIGDAVPISIYQNYTGYQTEDEIDGIAVHYYLSTDCELSSDDHYFDDDNSFIGNDDSSDKESYTMTIPDGISAGQYYVLFVADATNNVTEINEDNNVTCIPITINDSSLNIDENEILRKVNLYPNPVNNILTINLGKQFEKTEIQVFNLIGQRIKSYAIENKETYEINMYSLTNGVYIVKIKIDGKLTKEYKIIKH